MLDPKWLRTYVAERIAELQSQLRRNRSHQLDALPMTPTERKLAENKLRDYLKWLVWLERDV